jgi:hypothetical protein
VRKLVTDVVLRINKIDSDNYPEVKYMLSFLSFCHVRLHTFFLKARLNLSDFAKVVHYQCQQQLQTIVECFKRFH